MNMQSPSLNSAFHFNEYDLAANRRGEFSDRQREVVVLLGKITRAQRHGAISDFRTRSTTQSLPQIRVVTGHVHTLTAVRFARGIASKNPGLLIESFHLIVHGEHEDVDLPITQDAMHAFEPNKDYTVYYYINRGTPTLLSVYAAD